MHNTKSKRFVYLLLFILLMIIEILIALFSHNVIIRSYIGDLIVVIVIYYFIRIFIPTGIKYLPLYIFVFSVIVEFSQYFHLINILGLGNNTLAKVIFGTYFSVIDILCYALGCLIIIALQKLG